MNLPHIPDRILDAGIVFVHPSGAVTTQSSPHGPNGERHPRGDRCRCVPCRPQLRLEAA